MNKQIIIAIFAVSFALGGWIFRTCEKRRPVLRLISVLEADGNRTVQVLSKHPPGKEDGNTRIEGLWETHNIRMGDRSLVNERKITSYHTFFDMYSLDQGSMRVPSMAWRRAKFATYEKREVRLEE